MPSKRTSLHLLLLVAAVCTVFGGTLSNGFVWDDVVLMANNPVYRTFDLHRMLFSLGNGVEYLPVRDLSYAMDWLLWGGRPSGFHLTNLVLYAANVIAVYFLVHVMVRTYRPDDETGPAAAALATALLFALHPLHVEAAAFVTCRNVLLSGLFVFLSLLLFLRSAGRDRWAAPYAGSLAFFILALLSKATAIVLPLLLFVCLIPQKHGRTRLVLRTLPFFAVAGAAFVLFRSIALSTNVIRESAAGTPAGTLAVALQIPVFYLKKLVVPFPLSSEYAEVFPREPASPAALFALGLLVLLAAGAWAVRRRAPYLPAGLLWYLAALLPVMHFFPTYPVVADRYAYLPVLGFCLAAGVPLGLSACGRRRQAVLPAIALVALAWGVISFQRVPVWRTEESLWEDVIRNYPTHVKAYNSLGALHFQKGNPDRAFALFKQAQDLDPTSPMYDYFQGYLQYKAGNYAAALPHLDRAVARNGQFIMALYDEGLVHEKLGNRGQAIQWFRRVIASTDADPLGFYKNAAREHLRQLEGQTTH